MQRPLGASIVLDYEREGNTYRMPNNVWALSRVKVDDGHKDDGADKLLTTFTYEDGYHDRHERDFYGFAKVTTQTRDAQSGEEYRHLVQTFHNQDYYTKGLLLTETVADAKGNKYTEKENRYRLLEPATGEERASELPDYYSGRVFPALTQTVQRYYEGEEQAGKSTRTLLSYGTYGNVKKIEDLGDVDSPEDDLLAEVSYHTLTEPYVVNQPQHIEVSGEGQTYRVREAEIDPIGQVTAIRQYLDKDNVAVHSLSYDEYGNLKEVKRAANEKGERLSINYEYDQAVHTYVEKVSNSYGYTSKATYDYAFGQMLSSTDLNGQEVSYQLDALGRVKQIKGPYERQGGAGYTIRFAYHPKASIPWALTQHYDPAHPGNPLETVTFVDGLGRVLQTKKDVALFQGEGKADEEAMVVSGKVVYDAYGGWAVRP